MSIWNNPLLRKLCSREMNSKNEPFWKWLVKKVSHNLWLIRVPKRPMLVKVADVIAKMADVEPKMAVVLAEAKIVIKIPWSTLLKLMTRILVEQNLRKLEMPDYTVESRSIRTVRTNSLLLCKKWALKCQFWNKNSLSFIWIKILFDWFDNRVFHGKLFEPLFNFHNSK